MGYHPNSGQGGGGNLEVEDDSVSVTTAAQKLNFKGSGCVITEIEDDEIEITIAGGGSTAWGDITGSVPNQTDLQADLDGKANSSHNHAASGVNSGTFANARISQSSVTQHQAALSITEAQVSDLQSYSLSSHNHSGVYEPANATILKNADIGSTVQGYTAVLQNTTASFTTADETKLDGIEANATADQTGAQIKSAYEGEANTNAFTDSEQSKLSGIEANADVTDAVNVAAAGALMNKADVEAVLTGEISSHTHAGGGGGATPVHTLYFEGTLTSAVDTNDNIALPWNDATEHADITHTDGDSVISFDVAGEYDFYFNAEVTNGAANNRQTWALDLRHRDSGDVEKFTYTVASGSYIRDDASSYDSGLCAGHFNLVVEANDDITFLNRVLDTQTAAGVNNLDTSATYLRIFRKTYT